MSSGVLAGLNTKYLELLSIVNMSGLFYKLPDTAGYSRRADLVVPFIHYLLQANGIKISGPPYARYTGRDPIADLETKLGELKKELSSLVNNTSLRMPTPSSYFMKPDQAKTINEALPRLDDLISFIAAPGRARTASAAAVESRRITASAAAAATAQVEMNRKTASAAAAAAAAQSQRLTASAAAAAQSQIQTASAAAVLQRQTASAAAALQRQTASAAAAESRRMTASAATAAAAKAEMDKKTASAAAVAAEQERISGTLSSLSSSLQAVKSTLQAGGSASAPRANPIEAAIGAANTLYKTVNPSRVPNSVQRAVGSAVSELRNLQTKQRTVASKLNAAVKAINAAAAKKGGSRKNNFTRTRKGGSRSKRTRSRSRSRN